MITGYRLRSSSMKREIILGGAAVLTLVIGLGIAMRIMTTSSIPSTAPAQGSSKSVSGSRNEPSPDASSDGEDNKTSETIPRSITGVPQQINQAAASSVPTHTRNAPAAPVVTDKFSGTWVLDRARSEGLVPNMNQVMSVMRSGDTMNIKTKLSIDEQGEWTVNDTYVLSGRESEFSAQATGGGTAKGKRIAKLMNDGNSIEVSEHSTMEAQGAMMKVNIIRKWMLSDDKTLIIEMTVQGPRGTQQNKRLFIRK